MKKLYSSLFLLSLAISAGAQQLPNTGFETWVDCIPWNSINNTTVVGTTPEGWTVSNVVLMSIKVGTETTGKDGSKAVALTNTSTFGQNIPAYITLGTPWSTSVVINSKDGGTWGGKAFTYRPDAISFDYKHTGDAVPSSVVVYSWKGNVVQKNVPGEVVFGGTPTPCDMTDRDILVLGRSTDGKLGDFPAEYSSDFELISDLTDLTSLTATEWTNTTLEIPYKTASTPEKINVIISADNYFATAPTKGNAITIDNCKFIYYSRLKSLVVDGTNVALEDGKYDYDLSDRDMPADESAFVCTKLGGGQSATVTTALDRDAAKATITVANVDADTDGKAEHVYTLQFRKVAAGAESVYPGIVTVKACPAMGIGQDTDSDGSIHITPNADKTSCTFLLPNFTFSGLSVGDIKVDNVTMTATADGYSYSGSADGLALSGLGGMMVNVEISGWTKAKGESHFDIPVNIPQMNNVTLDVTFNSKASTGIGSIEADSAAPVEYYNIQGMRIAPEALTPGLYIRRQGDKTTKVIVK